MPTPKALARGYLSLCRFFTAAVWCVPALRVPFLVHSLINHFRQKKCYGVWVCVVIRPRTPVAGGHSSPVAGGGAPRTRARNRVVVFLQKRYFTSSQRSNLSLARRRLPSGSTLPPFHAPRSKTKPHVMVKRNLGSVRPTYRLLYTALP